MRLDLDRLMKERGVSGMVVIAQDRYTPAMYYATGQRIVHGVYFRAADGRDHLIHDPMERDQAALVGCPISSFAQHGMTKLQAEEGSGARVLGRMIGEWSAQWGLGGRIAFFGDMGAGFAWELIARAREIHPALEVDLSSPDVLTLARTTKGDDEIAATKRAARGTVAALARLRAFLESLRPAGDTFTNAGGVVKLGQLRELVQDEFLRHGLAEDGESIIAQGRDAGVPHNRGNDADPVRAGAPIIVDIFPGEAGGGYHSDVTRTFCMGPAGPELKRLWDDTHAAFRLAMDRLEVGRPCRDYQEMVCDLFESRGHATGRSKPGTEEGYVHGLGHGVGLSVHEAPRLGGPPSNTTLIEPGMVITVEPGLYYPGRGMGVRIEDLVRVRGDGTFENLTPAPYDLEIHPKG